MIVNADDGGQFGFTTVHPPEEMPVRGSVVLIPGLFTGINFWCSAKGVGLAAFLAENGYLCWLVERRGFAGMREQGDPAIRVGLQEHIQYDLPRLQTLVEQAHRGPVYWIGHSFGGVILAKALSRHLDQNKVAGAVLVASQVEVGLHTLVPPLSYVTRALAGWNGYLPVRRLGIGGFDEPDAAINDACDWVASARMNVEFFEGFREVNTPILATVGTGDRSDPPEGCRLFLEKFGGHRKEFRLLGRHNGYSEDFSHAGIVVSKVAQREVWPMFIDWFSRYH